MDFDHSPLHNQLCNYLRKKLDKTKIVLEYHKTASIERATNFQETAFRELEFVVRRADDLLLKCMCKQSSWLDAAITLPNIKEEVLDIVIDLFFWKRMLKIATAHSDKGGLAHLQYIAKAVEKDEELHEKLLKADSPLQKAADHDMFHLLAKLLEVKERYASGREGSTASIHEREYILSIYLLSRIKDDDRIATEVESQLRDIKWGKPLGSGTYGQVSEVEWLQQPCAVKKTKETDAKEAIMARGCNHPNIVQFFWVFQEERSSYIIMERMHEDLSEHIKRRLVERNGGRPFQLHVAIDIMLQIAKAMRYLHNKKPDKIVHRDLKTSNILVRPLTDHSQGYVHVKLADFGISKIYNMSVTSSPMSLKKGTSVYAAPEIFNNQSKYGSDSSKLPPKIDVWSFSMVCSEILTGTGPFPGEPKTNLHAKIEEMDDFRPPLPSDCPEDLRDCITRCWECDPRKRPTFIEICKMLKTAKAQSLGIIHFTSSKRLASINQTTVNNPTSRLLTSEPQAAGSRGDSNVETTGGLNENREVEQISSAVARCSLNLSGPLSDSEMVDPVEAVDTDYVAASPDQAVEGDVSNRLGHGAPNNLPTSEPQAKGVDLPKAGLTVAAWATIPSQGTTPRNPTSSQPMMMMWNDEEERRPPDSSRVSRPQVPLLPQDYQLCGEQGHQFRQPHYLPSLMDQGMLGQFPESSMPHPPEPAPAVSSQNEAKATRNQLVHLDLFPELGVGLQQSRMVTTATVQLATPTKGTTGVTKEGVQYPAPVPIALPPHSVTQHSTGTDMRQMSWPRYGGQLTSGMTNSSSEVQPLRANSAGASDVEKKAGLEMITTATVQLTVPPKGTTGVAQEEVWYPATVLAALPPHSGMQHSSDIGPRQMTWPPHGGLPTFGTTNLSLEVQPPRASSPGASDVEKKEGLDNERQHGRVCGEEGHHFREPHYIPSLMDDDRMRDHFPESPIPPTTEPAPAVSSQNKAKATSNQLVDLDLPSEMGVGLPQPRTVTTATLQPTTLTKGTTRVTQSEVRYPAAVPPALPPHSGTQHSTGTGLRQQITWPLSGGLATSGRTNLSSEMQLQGAGSAGIENGPKEGNQLREPHYLLSLTDEWMSGQFPQSSTAHTPEPAPAVSSQNEAKVTRNQLVDLDLFPEMGVGLQQSRMAATAAFQPTSPMKGTTGVNQEGIWYPAAGSVALPTHSGTQHSTGTDTWAMTWPVSKGLGTSGRTNLSSEVQPRGAGSAHASNVEKKGGQENWLFDLTEHTHMGQMTRSPYGGLPTSGRTNLLSEVQPQPPRADFASGSNVEKKGGLVDDGQRQLQNPSKNNPPLHSGLSGADSNLVAAMGQNTTPNPTFKPPQAQIALQQDKPMPQYAELMAKEEERKKSTVCKKELNQLQHDSKESEIQNKRRKADSPP